MKVLTQLLSQLSDEDFKKIQIPDTTPAWSKIFYTTLLLEPLRAITMYARKKGKSIKDSTETLNKIYSDFISFLIQDKYFKDIVPTCEKCCINCFGFCFYFYEKNWIDYVTGTLRGNDCKNFVSKEELISIFETQTGALHFSTLSSDILKFALIYDKGYVLWRNLKYNSKVLDKREVPEIISGLIKTRNNLSRSNRLYFSFFKNKGFIINNILPIRGETYTEYFKRCQKEIKETNIRRSNKLLSLPEEEVVSKLNDYFLKSNLDSIYVNNYNKDIYEFIVDYFPGQDIWEVAEELLIQEFDNE
ncbi:MAG: hypothetical protein ACP6IQ_01990 [Candidatus Njordarchaeia archaeon]